MGSRIKAQGEEEDDWKRRTGAAKAKAAVQAGGVGPLCVFVCVCARACVFYSLLDIFSHPLKK